MKKLILIGAWAFALLAACQQPASAWLNFKFGAGINWNWQSGGNNTLWGLFRNGQPPGSCGTDPSMIGGPGNPFQCGPQGGCNQGGCCPPPCYMPQQMQCAPQQGCQQPGGAQRAPLYFPGFNYYNNQEFQYFGRQQPSPQQQPAVAPDMSQPSSLASANWYGQQYQHSAAYYPPYAQPYTTTSYYPPAYYQPPSPYNYGFNYTYRR